MYEEHFGLERRIFRSNAAGADVFIGPQMARILSGVKKAVAGPDAVIMVTGPVGAGKSTAVAHSLGTVSGKNAIARVGRIPLQRGEVLDLLFDHMRIQQRPPRGNQKLALFRRLLFNLAENKSRMFILVEDALFLGEEILAELEVLTAADTGPSDGANIILMGDESLRELLASKRLARLRQRNRLRRTLEPCSVEELAGYLRHCFRQAGSEFGDVFADGAFGVLHELSGGVFRVVNNLVEASLEAAADSESDTVDLDLIARVASEEFGLTGAFSAPPQIADDTPEPKLMDHATAKLVAISMPDAVARKPASRVSAEPEPAPASEPEPARQAEPVLDLDAETSAVPGGTATADDAEDDIPELIEDTHPALATLPDVPEPNPEKESKPQLIEDTLPNLETLSPELARQAAATETSDSAEVDTIIEKPDWDRDPTLAELRPDLEALERAMAVAQGRNPDADDKVAKPAPPPDENKKEETLVGVPEITLDESISRKVDAAAFEQKQRQEEESGIVEEEVDTEAEAELGEQKQKQADAELEKIAAGLAQAKSIEDVDDKMAETLFGEELSVAAAAVAKRVAQERAAAANETDEPVKTREPPPASNGNQNPMEKEFEKVRGETPGVEVPIESQIEGQTGRLGISASQRLATVRALNNNGGTAAPPRPLADSPAPAASKPEPIEEQITVSMTQTMKALNVPPEPAALNDDDDDDDEQKGGFFSRFRRS